MKRVAILLGVLIVAFAATVGAADFQLTAINTGAIAAGCVGATANSCVTINGAIFTTNDQQPTGTGVIDPFLKFQGQPNNFTQAYNYDAATIGIPIDSNDAYGTANYTHLVTTSSLAVFNIGGTNYWKFLLDIDQTGSSPFLSLDYLTFSTSNDPTLDGNITLNNPALPTFPNLGTIFYTLGANHLELDYRLNSGSGSGDLYVFVPVPTTFGTYLYLANAMGYSATLFGNVTTENDGPEEWAGFLGAPPVPDGGATLTLLGFALVGLGVLRRRFHL